MSFLKYSDLRGTLMFKYFKWLKAPLMSIFKCLVDPEGPSSRGF